MFEANPFLIALGLIAERRWRSFASRVLASQLRAPGLYLGPGCRVIGGRHISFGRGVYANRNLWLQAVTSFRDQRFTPAIAIGDFTAFADGVHVAAIDKVAIGRHVLMGSKIYIADHNHGFYKGPVQSRPEEAPARRPLGGCGPVIIGDNVWIGDNAVILGPASIGSGAIIAANSVVRGDVPPNSIVAGSPARIIKTYNPATGSWEKTSS